MVKVRKRPVETEAALFRSSDPAEALAFAPTALTRNLGGGYSLWVEQSQAWIDLQDEHWILAERTGSGFYPVTVESFEDAYELVED